MSINRNVKRLIKLRAEMKRRKPNFVRMNSWRIARINDSWRSPRRSLDNKIRLERKGFPLRVKAGYRSPRATRGLHPSGKTEVLVHSPEELEGLDPKLHIIRIASTVGARKRGIIISKATEMGLYITNAGLNTAV
ncbi:MAG: 50S ribosomal protein L32e [Thermofilaceae archaeon]